MKPNSPKIIDAVRRTHKFLVDLYNRDTSTEKDIVIADGVDDIFLWVKEDRKTPTPRPATYTKDIELYDHSDDDRKCLHFQLFTNSAISDYTVECTFHVKTGKIIVEDLHVL